MKRRPRDESGAVAVVVAFFSVVMFAFGAIVVDLGQARGLRVQAQTGADSAALAATNAIYARGTPVPDVPGAVAAAKTYAADNLGVTAGEWGTCTDPARPAAYVVPAGSTPCISFSPNLARPGLVRVALPVRPSTSYFSGALGVGTPNIGATAEAAVRVDGVAPCALCVLGTGTHSLGQGDVKVSGGDVYYNGSVDIGSNGLSSSTGNIYVQNGWSGSRFTPSPQPGPLLTDPLSRYTLPVPPTYGGLSTTLKTNPCAPPPVGGPGIYGAWSLPNNTTCTLTAGLYVIAGPSGTVWDLRGNSNSRLVGDGVTLYFTCATGAAPRACTSGETGATMDATGQARITLSGPPSGELWGLTLVYDRLNSATFRMTGSAGSSIQGTIYMLSALALMNGNACLDAYATLVIVGDIALNGNNACLEMTYDSTKGAQAPPDNLRLTK